MDETTKQQLIEASRSHLVEARQITMSGYAGILPHNGMIVDRRKYPEAIPVPKNAVFGLPEPKPLPDTIAVDYESDEEECYLVSNTGRKIRWIREGKVTGARARELIYEYNKEICNNFKTCKL